MQIKWGKDWDMTFLLGSLLACFLKQGTQPGLVEWNRFSPSRHLLFVWWHEWGGCYSQPQCYQPLPSTKAMEAKLLLRTGPAGQCTGCMGWQGWKQKGNAGGLYEAGPGKTLLLMYLIKWILGTWLSLLSSGHDGLQRVSTRHLKLWH